MNEIHKMRNKDSLYKYVLLYKIDDILLGFRKK